MSISEAIQAFLFAKEIQGLSATLRNYRLTLARFQAFFDGEDPALKNITAKEILAFLHLLRTKIFNGDLRDKFCEWYPDMSQSTENLPLAI
jgi:site-specific recombinase XerD